jgi:hypothetical protein
MICPPPRTGGLASLPMRLLGQGHLPTGLAVAMFVLFKMLKNGTHGTTSRKTLYSSGGGCQRYFHHHVTALAGACGHDRKHDHHARELSVMNVSCSV